jgi:hypothetical protein
MNNKYKVILNTDEQTELSLITTQGKHSVRKIKRAQILLMVSRPAELPREPLAKRCGSLSTHTASIKQTHFSFLSANAKTVSVALLQLFQERLPLFSYLCADAGICSSPTLQESY